MVDKNKILSDFNYLVAATVENNPDAVVKKLKALNIAAPDMEAAKSAVLDLKNKGLYDQVYFVLNVPYISSERLGDNLFNAFGQVVQAGAGFLPSIVNSASGLIGTTVQSAGGVAVPVLNTIGQNPSLSGTLQNLINPAAGIGSLFGQAPQGQPQAQKDNTLLIVGVIFGVLLIGGVMYAVIKK